MIGWAPLASVHYKESEMEMIYFHQRSNVWFFNALTNCKYSLPPCFDMKRIISRVLEVNTKCLLELFGDLQFVDLDFSFSHSSTPMKHSEASVFTVADLAELFTEDGEALE